jgi:hypothetical protein
LRCGFPCSSNDVEPFGSDMEVDIVPEIAAQKFPTFSGGTCTPANIGVRFHLHSLNFPSGNRRSTMKPFRRKWIPCLQLWTMRTYAREVRRNHNPSMQFVGLVSVTADASSFTERRQ